jgi:hypothetical protein
MKFVIFIVRKQHILFLVAAMSALSFAVYKEKPSIDIALIAFTIHSMIFFSIGMLLSKVIYFTSQILNKTDSPAVVKMVLLGLAVFEIFTGLLKGEYFSSTAILYVLSGYAYLPVISKYRVMIKIKKLCRFYSKLTAKEKKVILDNINTFITEKFTFFVTTSFSGGFMVGSIDLDTEAILTSEQPFKLIKNFPFFELQWKAFIILYNIYDFSTVRHRIIAEDEQLYNESIIIDGTIVRLRNKLEGEKALFKNKWKIDPLPT